MFTIFTTANQKAPSKIRWSYTRLTGFCRDAFFSYVYVYVCYPSKKICLLKSVKMQSYRPDCKDFDSFNINRCDTSVMNEVISDHTAHI